MRRAERTASPASKTSSTGCGKPHAGIAPTSSTANTDQSLSSRDTARADGPTFKRSMALHGLTASWHSPTFDPGSPAGDGDHIVAGTAEISIPATDAVVILGYN